MAEADYVRLAAACHCGEPVRLSIGRGRPPKYCKDHGGPSKPEKAAKEQKQCPACRGFFVPGRQGQQACSRLCRVRLKRGNKPRNEVRRYTCAHCGHWFDSTHSAPMYCGKPCKQRAWLAARGIVSNQRPPRFSRYMAAYCADCGQAFGSRSFSTRCSACTSARRGMTAAQAARQTLELIHRSSARETVCGECGCRFCPLYGHSHAALCSACVPERKKREKAAHKAKRRAIERGVDAQRVDPFVVFDRDGWRCQLCKTRTPKAKRGSHDDNAPELDHIVPLAKGGAHTYANTQCACRRCNGLKSDRPLGQMLLFG